MLLGGEVVELVFRVFRRVVEQRGREKGGGRPEESASTNSVTPQSLMEDLGISLGTQTWDNPMSVLEDGTRFSWQGKRG